MPSEKDRLYVALYARGGTARMPGLEDKYHWALVSGPKAENERSQGTRFHAKETVTLVEGKPQSVWVFEERSTSMAPTAMILIRVTVGKVKSTERLRAILRSTPVRGGEPGWNCVAWVKEAVEKLGTDERALGTSDISWDSVRNAAMRYVEWKRAEHRFDGQGNFDTSRVATWDLLENKESVR